MGSNKEPEYVPLREDRRKDLRSQLLVLRVKSADKKTFFGYGKTLGQSGMFIASVNPQEAGSEFEISFMLPDDKTEVKCRCRVAWTRQYASAAGREPGMGIEFLDLEPHIKAKIDEWVKKEPGKDKPFMKRTPPEDPDP
jgi:Tfp pilus assembly protein PilZ